MYKLVSQAKINRLDQHTFKVYHNEEFTGIRKEYEVFLGNEYKFCSSSCHDFRRCHMLFLHYHISLQFLIQTRQIIVCLVIIMRLSKLER